MGQRLVEEEEQLLLLLPALMTLYHCNMHSTELMRLLGVIKGHRGRSWWAITQLVGRCLGACRTARTAT
jgi:hypothetical protein